MNEETSRRVSERAFSRGSAVGWYAVDMVEGRTYALDLPREPSASLPVLGIYGPTGQLVADTRRQGQGIGSVCKMAFTPEETGTYYVRRRRRLLRCSVRLGDSADAQASTALFVDTHGIADRETAQEPQGAAGRPVRAPLEAWRSLPAPSRGPPGPVTAPDFIRSCGSSCTEPRLPRHFRASPHPAGATLGAARRHRASGCQEDTCRQERS